MKFVVSSSELLKTSLSVSKALPQGGGASDAILEAILFSLQEDRLTLTATDRELTLTAVITVEQSLEEGSIAIPAKQFMDLLKELPDQPITITSHPEGHFECTWLSGFSTIPYYNSEDYPQISTIEENKENVTKFEISGNSLLGGITNTIYATGDESVKVLAHILMDIHNNVTTFVGTDMYKMICYSCSDVKAGEEKEIILNKRLANVLKSLLSKEVETVCAVVDENLIQMTWNNIKAICCKYWGGNYVNYKKAIPQNNSNILSVNRAELIKTVKRISIFAPKSDSNIWLNLKNGSMEISAEDSGYAIYAKDSIKCEYSGNELLLGCASHNLLETLNNFNCSEVRFKLESMKPILLEPADKEDGKEKIFGVIQAKTPKKSL